MTDTQKKYVVSQGYKPSTKGISFFKTYQGRRGGKQKVHRYLKLLDDGTIKTVDVTRKKVSTLKSFGSEPLMLTNSTRKELDSAYNSVIKTFK